MTDTDEPQATKRLDVCSLTAARRVAAMLGVDASEIVEGRPLPRGWHFFLLGAETPRSELRSDGFPGFGVPMPDLGLPRLLIGSRKVSWQGDIEIGAQIERTSRVAAITEKSSQSGPMAIVEIEHALRPLAATEPAIIETQTYLLLEATDQKEAPEAAPETVSGDRHTSLIPDETMLFQYSALGFNSHRIHFDRDYARDVEGLPDVLVNGGLTTLLLTEFLRTDLGVSPTAIKTRYTAPLYCQRTMTLAASRHRQGWQLFAYDDQPRVAAEMEVQVR